MHFLLYLNEEQQQALLLRSAEAWPRATTLPGKLIVVGDTTVEFCAADSHRIPEEKTWTEVPLLLFQRVGLTSETLVSETQGKEGRQAIPDLSGLAKYHLHYWQRDDNDRHLYVLGQSIPSALPTSSKQTHLIQRAGCDFHFRDGDMDIDRGLVLVPSRGEAVEISLTLLAVIGLVTLESVRRAINR